MPKGAYMVAEFFLLRELEKTAVISSPELDEARATLLDKRNAAEALWEAGASEEALRVAEEAINGSAGGRSPSARYAAAFEEIDRRLRAQRPLTRRDVRAMRLSRLVTAMVLFASAVGLLYVERTRKPPPPMTEASAQWDARYPAENAVDGDDATDWILPDKAPGWLDLRLKKARNVARIKITNARNPPYFDRSAHELRVEAFHGETLVKTAQLQFEAPTRTPDIRTVDLGASIDRVRITVASHHLSGGGLAEVVLE